MALARPPAWPACPQISAGHSSHATSRRRLLWPHAPEPYCLHSTYHKLTSDVFTHPLSICHPPPTLLPETCSGEDLWHLSKLLLSGCSRPICQITERASTCLSSRASVWSFSIDPDVLVSLVNYRTVIIVRSVSRECINGKKHKRLHAPAHRTLEPMTASPQPAGV